MLCEKCHKNEATVHIGHATSCGEFVNGVYQQVPGPPPSTQNLCPDCAEAQDVANSHSLEGVWKPEDKPVTFPAFFTHAFQNVLLNRLENEAPGIFDLHPEKEEPDGEKFATRWIAIREKFTAEITRELDKRGIVQDRFPTMMMAIELLGVMGDRLHRKKFARLYPSLTPQEIEGLLFVEKCGNTILNGPRVRKYADVRGEEILAVSPLVAKKLYGESARSELKKLGIVSSEALGGIILRLMEKGILDKSHIDRIEDFKMRSPLDEFLAQGDEA